MIIIIRKTAITLLQLLLLLQIIIIFVWIYSRAMGGDENDNPMWATDSSNSSFHRKPTPLVAEKKIKWE